MRREGAPTIAEATSPGKWVTSHPPHAVLSPVDLAPQPGPNGATVQRYATAFGRLFMRVVEPSGYTYWMRLVKE